MTGCQHTSFLYKRTILQDTIDFPITKKGQKTKWNSETANSLDGPVMPLESFLYLCCCSSKGTMWWILSTNSQPENSTWCLLPWALLTQGRNPGFSPYRHRVASKEHHVTQSCVLVFTVWERRRKDSSAQFLLIYRNISSLLWNSFIEVGSLLTSCVTLSKFINLSGTIHEVQIV